MHSSLKTFYVFGNLSEIKNNNEISEFGYHFEAYEKVCCDKEEPSFKFSFFVMSTHKISRYTQYGPIKNVGIFPGLGVLYFYPDFQG